MRTQDAKKNHKGDKQSANISLLQPVIDDRVYVAQHISPANAKNYRCFSTVGLFEYHALCDDFGPMNMSCVVRFITLLDEEMSSFPNSKIAYCSEHGRRALANSVFLLGSYLVVKRGQSAEEVSRVFAWVDLAWAEPFRDATFAEPDFELSLQDCWRALERGRALGWIRMPVPSAPGFWGMMDVDEYDHYDDPLNGDLHIVVPGTEHVTINVRGSGCVIGPRPCREICCLQRAARAGPGQGVHG